MDERFLTTAQVADRLSVNRTTVLRWVDSGRMSARVLRYGPRALIRIPEREVEAFIARWEDTGEGPHRDER